MRSELAGVVTLIINILQSVYAFKYPRTPVPSTPVSKSNKALVTPSTNPKSKRKLGGLSPHTSPQPQRSFSSSYASSPLSTPSRTLNYTAPSPSSPYNLSMNSSFGSSIGTTSSVAGAGSPLAAYRGKHADRVGRKYLLSLYHFLLSFFSWIYSTILVDFCLPSYVSLVFANLLASRAIHFGLSRLVYSHYFSL